MAIFFTPPAPTRLTTDVSDPQYRYISTSMKQKTGDRTLVALVSGEDRYGHFSIAGPPQGRLAVADFDLCRT